MQILMTNYYLGGGSGSETYTSTVAQELRRRGHDVWLMYGEYAQDGNGRDDLADFTRTGIDSAAWFGDWIPDIIHAQQNPTTKKARHLYPETPMVYLCHGTHDELENPPEGCNVSRWLACSQEVADWMVAGFPWVDDVEVIGQPINTFRFRPTRPLNAKPRNALIMSAHMEQSQEDRIREACAELDITVKAIGGRNGGVPQDRVAEMMNEADIVFALGRGAYEAMACGRIPFIYDHHGGDGLVWPGNVDYLSRYNFSGRAYGDLPGDDLVALLQCYDAKEGDRLREWVWQRYSVGKVVDRLEEIYHEAM